MIYFCTCVRVGVKQLPVCSFQDQRCTKKARSKEKNVTIIIFTTCVCIDEKKKTYCSDPALKRSIYCKNSSKVPIHEITKIAEYCVKVISDITSPNFT